jgi:hypothetical protein
MTVSILPARAPRFASTPWVRLGALALLLLATHGVFFDIYRSAIFNTVAHDDYAPLLQHIVGDGGRMLEAPFGYRILSVLVAVPFYYTLPTLTFSHLPEGIDLAYLRATEALSMVSYLSMLATCVVLFWTARVRFRAGIPASLTVGFLAYLLLHYIARESSDAFAVFLIALLVHFQARAAAFVPLVLLSVGINEKIPILFTTFTGMRLLLGLAKPRHGRSLRPRTVTFAASVAAVALYFAVRHAVNLPGPEQTNPTLFLPHFVETLEASFTSRGLVLNVLPVLILCGLAVLAVIAHHAMSERHEHFAPVDCTCLVVLVLLGSIVGLDLNLGRIAMYAFPFYLPILATLLERWGHAEVTVPSAATS